MKSKKIRQARSPEHQRAVEELRRSNAASKHTSKKSRAQERRDAIRAEEK